MRRVMLMAVLGLSVAVSAEDSAKAPLAEAPKPTAEAPKAAASLARVTGGLRTWFQHLKEGLTESSVSAQRQRGHVTAVAAVRGSQQGSAEVDKPAWKSGAQTRKSRLMRQQRQEFAAAVDLALEGKYAEAGGKLDAFQKAYPDSPLLPEVKEAREKAREAQDQAAAAPAATPAPPTGGQ